MVTGIIQTIMGRGTRRTPGTRTGRFDRSRGADGTALAATGTVTAIRDRGFGYIARDGEGGGADLFFHRSAVAGDGFARLREGERVSFEEEPDPRDRNRQRAVNVRPTGDQA